MMAMNPDDCPYPVWHYLLLDKKTLEDEIRAQPEVAALAFLDLREALTQMTQQGNAIIGALAGENVSLIKKERDKAQRQLERAKELILAAVDSCSYESEADAKKGLYSLPSSVLIPMSQWLGEVGLPEFYGYAKSHDSNCSKEK